MPQSIMPGIISGTLLNEPTILALNGKLYQQKSIKINVLRLDEIHPVISGNKLFKLYYFLEEAKKYPNKTLVTFGGAFSNHLAATAFACENNNLRCIGYVRGERPSVLSPTLSFCLEHQMQLEFISREDYKKSNEETFLNQLREKYEDPIIVPEGGFSIKGAKGAELITQYYRNTHYTHVCLAVGTATTLAGIINGSNNDCETIGFSVLKNMYDIDERLDFLQTDTTKKYTIKGDYHFGGYAKKTRELINFMNRFYDAHKVPLDFVYTAKMMFGVHDMIEKNYFPPGAQILCIHTGGLQGNNSLETGILHF